MNLRNKIINWSWAYVTSEFSREISAGSEVGISTVAFEDRASVRRGRIRARFARQGYEHRRNSRFHDRRGEDPEGRRVCLWTDRSAVRISTVEGGAASERDSTARRLHDTAGRARLSHHRIRRIRLLTVSTRRDIFDRRYPDTIYGLSVSRTSGLIDKGLATPAGSESTRLRHACQNWF